MKKSLFTVVIAAVLVAAGLVGFNAITPEKESKTQAVAENMRAESAVSRVARQLSPAIVGITAIGSEGDFFSQRAVEKSGSGVVVDPDGYIVTNNHVVENADRFLVVMPDGSKRDARLIGRDRRTDLALLKVSGQRMVTAQFGDSSRLVVGEGVVAIGNPLGQRFARSVTSGIISGLNRLLTTQEGFVFRLIQTDAAINPGNSGGALANLNGEVIGINTIKIAVSGFEGMGFAIPSNQVKSIIQELRDHGRVTRPVAGLKVVKEVSAADAKYYNLPVAYGVAVVPAKSGPAHQAGLRDYDIIQAVDGHKVTSAAELQNCMFNCKIGDQVTVTAARLTRGGTLQKYKYRIKLDGDR
ncbi:MAG: S1C family serine protease [Solirubrobacterales bacterium]